MNSKKLNLCCTLSVLCYYFFISKGNRSETLSTHDEIVAQMEIYVTENNKFVEKGIKSSATRARKALSEIAKLAKARRAEITDEKDAMDKE